MAQRIGQDHRLFGNLLGHEMLVAGLFDPGCVDLDRGQGAVGAASFGIINLGPGTADDGPIALFQIGDPVCHWGQGNGIAAHIHLASAMPDRERAAFSGGDHQIILPVEQKAQGKGPVQACQGLFCRLDRRQALIQIHSGQKCHGFGISLGFKPIADGGKFAAQLAKIFDDAVMHHRHAARLVRMGIGHRGRAMRGPAGVADAGLARERLMHQKV
jgi:hypothetical protein